jgi:hypothetical protein
MIIAPQYETLTKYDRVYAGLIGGNNLQTKATTIEYVQTVTGETETYIIQTVRAQDGDYIVIKFMDKEGVKRLVLPPRVANTIGRQHNTLSTRGVWIAGSCLGS